MRFLSVSKRLVFLMIGLIAVSSCNTLDKQDDYLVGTRWEKVEKQTDKYDLVLDKQVYALEFYGNRKMVFFYGDKVYEGKYK